ncbi:hypothetical protein PROPEN_04563 [Proteus penneri ATCC 35198]|nr:hypothetical protein PROPEN_04563 [Proteus penneri ATCC 35198]
MFPWILGQEPKYTIPLTLGVVAAALTDLDDRLVGRLKKPSYHFMLLSSCFSIYRITLSISYFILLWFSYFYLGIYFIGCFRATVRNYCFWCFINRDLYYARYAYFP